MTQDKMTEQFIGVTEILPNILAIELCSLGDVWKKFRILPADDKWTVPYLKYAYRSIYHTRNFRKDFYCGDETPLPPGSYEIMFTTKNCSEEQATGIVQKLAGLQRTYKNYHEGDWCWSATESLQSLLKSKGLAARNYLIIKRVEG